MIKKKFYAARAIWHCHDGYELVDGYSYWFDGWCRGFVYYFPRYHKWVPCELVSGQAFPVYAKTRQAAIKNANKMCREYGKNEVLRLIEKAIDEHMQMPGTPKLEELYK